MGHFRALSQSPLASIRNILDAEILASTSANLAARIGYLHVVKLFHRVRALRDEFIANGYNAGEVKGESRDDGSKFKVFYAIAPDGLCYWFGQRE